MNAIKNFFPTCGSNALKPFTQYASEARIIEFPQSFCIVEEEEKQGESLRDIVIAFIPCVLMGFLFVI